MMAGAAGEIISDRVDGFLIEPGDVHLLAGRLKVLNENSGCPHPNESGGARIIICVSPGGNRQRVKFVRFC